MKKISNEIIVNAVLRSEPRQPRKSKLRLLDYRIANLVECTKESFNTFVNVLSGIAKYAAEIVSKRQGITIETVITNVTCQTNEYDIEYAKLSSLFHYIDDINYLEILKYSIALLFKTISINERFYEND